MLKTLIKKEIREHQWVFAAAFAVMVLGYLRSMYALLPDQAWRHVTRRSFLMVTSIGGGGFMLALGFRQMFEEQRRGLWTFLLHRPIARQRIFFAKIFAALVMFCLAIVLPTAIATAWCAWPGNIAGPFVPSMLYPPAGDLLCALPYYFAGCVVGLWQARLTASRAIVLAIPLANSVFTHAIAEEVWMVVLSCLFATLWLGWLARVCFMGLERRHTLGWTALASALSFGLACVQLVANAFMPVPMTEYSGHFENVNQYWFVSANGEVQRAVTRDGDVEAVFTVAGEPVTLEAKADDGRFGGHGAESVAVSPKFPATYERPRYRSVHRFERLAQLRGDYNSEWYYDRERRRFIAFDRSARTFSGSLGPEGFATADDGAGFQGQPLVELHVAPRLFVSEGGVFTMDWQRREISRVKLVTQTPLERRNEFHRGRDGRWVVRSKTHVEVLVGPEAIAAIALDPSLSNGDESVGYVEAKNEYFVRYSKYAPQRFGHRLLLPQDDSDTFVFYASDGRELRRVTTPPTSNDRGPAVAPLYSYPLRHAVVLPPLVTWCSLLWQKAPRWASAQWTATHALVALLAGLLSAFASLLLSRGHVRGLRVTFAVLSVIAGPTSVALPWLLPKASGVACPTCAATRTLNKEPCKSCDTQLVGYQRLPGDIVDDAFMPGA